jgi:tRNA acetyltransferase TAN1
VLSQEATLQPGDTGIWITCARHQESKAAREIEVLFAEVCLPPPSQA